MQTQTTPNTPRKIGADKLCTAAVVSLLLGIALFVLCLVLDRFIQPYYRSLEDVFALGIWVSIAVVGFVVPLLGLIAVINILSNWRSVTNPDDGPKDERKIRTTGSRFLITSLLFALVPISATIVRTFVGALRNTNLPDLEAIWLIVMALMALAIGFVSYRLFAKTSVRILPRVGAILVIIFGFCTVVSVFLSTSLGYYLIQRLEYSKITKTFSGSSALLERTTIVPTLDSQSPQNRNVIWCSSFQLAWNQMKDDVIGGPVQVVGAEELAARLNSAEQSSADIEPRSFYPDFTYKHEKPDFSKNL